jgi:hypothetical protein
MDPPPLEYLCLVTTPSYAPGAVCLAQSLALVGSRATLRVIATSEAAAAALWREAAASPGPKPPPLVVDLQLTELPPPPPGGSTAAADSGGTHGSKGAYLSVDAPRRALWSQGKPFALLDADLLAVQNPDPFLAPLVLASAGLGEKMSMAAAGDLWAVANFRLKKRCFGGADGNFNAGVLLVPQPQHCDGEVLSAMVAAAAARGDPNETEELLLNRVFTSGRWHCLPRGLNVPKRVAHHAPALWKDMVVNKELVFVHYMGAKPWQTSG